MVEVIALIVALVASLLGFGEYQRRKGRRQVAKDITQASLLKQNHALQLRLQSEQASKQQAEEVATQVAKDVERIQEEGATRVDNLTPVEASDFIGRARQVDRES